MIKLNQLKLKNKSCIRNDGHQSDLDNSIQMYVVVTRNCNANCKFCEFRGNIDKIDTDIFYKTLYEIIKHYTVGTIHFTGGEPTLELNTVQTLCNITKSLDDSIITSINTNGIHLKELKDIKNLDNVALSRHAITDEENKNIFETDSIATSTDIKAFPKNKLHLSCNLIKDYIDSEEKIYQYLDYYSALGVYDIGFVGLMKINEYCIDNYVEYPELSKCTSTRGYKNIENDICSCECRNWLYRTKDCNLVSIYHRHVLKDTDAISYLVYENNKLKVGFNGDDVEL